MGQKHPVKILLVDDEPNILTALEFLMQQEGFETATALNGELALEKLSDFHPDIMILDVMMPGMDGFSVAKAIRQQPIYQDLRIIFLTAKGTTADRFNGYASGGEIYLTKPFDNEELLNVVSEVVEFG
ncbi:MAG: response regulator [Phaeodactylibacter sp.]|nr:response regulator [Phaeodactylibacter sp.]